MALGGYPGRRRFLREWRGQRHLCPRSLQSGNPRLVDRGGQPNPIPNSQTGGFRVGPIFAVGNILVISANDGRGYATLDISDPINPSLLDSMVSGSPKSYSSMVNGNRIYAAGTDDDLHGFDISNPRQIRRLDSVP